MASGVELPPAVEVLIGEVRTVVTSSQGDAAQVANAGPAYSATATTNSIERCLFNSNLVFGVRRSACDRGGAPTSRHLPRYRPRFPHPSRSRRRHLSQFAFHHLAV